MKRLIVLMCVLAMCLTGCGSNTAASSSDTATAVSHGVVASTSILTLADLAERDGTEYVQESEEESETESEDESEQAETESETGEAETEPVETEAVSVDETGTYRYQSYVLSKAKTSNAVFSPQAFLTSVSMWSQLLTEDTASTLQSYAGRDYLGFSESGGFSRINLVYVDASVSVSSDTGLDVTSVDMSDPSATSEKNQTVYSLTNGYLSYTPVTFSESTKLDISSILLLNAGWQDGSRSYDTKSRIFYNSDGTETRTVMMTDEGLTYWSLDNATAYCMYLSDGSYIMFVLPDEGVSLSDVDVSSLMSGEVSSKKAHVKFYVPEFSVESSYTIRLSDFGQDSGTVDTELVSGLDGYTPVFYQIEKLDLTVDGIGSDIEHAATVVYDSFDEDLDTINIVCNRPFLYYVGDSVNEDIAFFGVVNQVTDPVSEEDAGIQVIE